VNVVEAVREHLQRTFPGALAAASVTFLGTEQLDVLRFGPDEAGVVRYATVGVSRHPMHPPTAAVVDPVQGPRAELVLSLNEPRDEVLRALAVLAATPAVEGVVLGTGVTLDLQQPLWPGARATAALLGEPGGLVPDLPLDGLDPVRFHPIFPMSASEAALSRAKGAAHVRQRWLDAGTDLRDPARPGVV
jgi:suppressor of fused protein SUFU